MCFYSHPFCASNRTNDKHQSIQSDQSKIWRRRTKRRNKDHTSNDNSSHFDTDYSVAIHKVQEKVQFRKNNQNRSRRDLRRWIGRIIWDHFKSRRRSRSDSKPRRSRRRKTSRSGERRTSTTTTTRSCKRRKEDLCDKIRWKVPSQPRSWYTERMQKLRKESLWEMQRKHTKNSHSWSKSKPTTKGDRDNVCLWRWILPSQRLWKNQTH